MRLVIARVGRALYGAQWKSPLARELGVHERSLRRWAAGEARPPADLLLRLNRIISERIDELRGLTCDGLPQKKKSLC